MFLVYSLHYENAALVPSSHRSHCIDKQLPGSPRIRGKGLILMVMRQDLTRSVMRTTFYMNSKQIYGHLSLLGHCRGTRKLSTRRQVEGMSQELLVMGEYSFKNSYFSCISSMCIFCAYPNDVFGYTPTR